MFGSALTQGIGKLIGLQDSFSWAGVAAAGVAGGLGDWTAGKLGLGRGSFGYGVASATAGGIANAAMRSALNGESFGTNLEAAIPDIIGQAIGGAIGKGVRSLFASNSRTASGHAAAGEGTSKLGDMVKQRNTPSVQQPDTSLVASPVERPAKLWHANFDGGIEGAYGSGTWPARTIPFVNSGRTVDSIEEVTEIYVENEKRIDAYFATDDARRAAHARNEAMFKYNKDVILGKIDITTQDPGSLAADTVDRGAQEAIRYAIATSRHQAFLATDEGAKINTKLTEKAAAIDTRIQAELNRTDMIFGGVMAVWTLPFAGMGMLEGGGYVAFTSSAVGTTATLNHAAGLPIGLAGGNKLPADLVVSQFEI